VIDLKDRAFFLNKMHLFNGLKEEDLAGIGVKLEEREVPADTIIFQRGAKPDGFYLIYKGRVKITRPREKGEDDFLAWISAGDYFGEEALFENRNRSATITTMEDSVLFFLNRAGFDELLTRYPKLKPNIQVTIQSHKLARQTRFKWLGAKEVIYFIARRHKIRLYQALAVPLLSLFVPGVLFAWGLLSGATTPLALALIAGVGILGWGIWNAIDWSNDYYIVTNQRVIWLEKVIGLYDSRQEAPLGTILSVGIETDMIGRALDYGNVIVRTFVGKLEFDHVDHPVQAADMIREYWERTKAGGTQAQKDAMKDSIRLKLGLPVEKKPPEELAPVVVHEEDASTKPLWMLAIADLFKLRIEDGASVTYRKHWVVFLQRAWKPLAYFLALLALMMWRAWSLYQSPDQAILGRNSLGAFRPDTIMVAIPLFMLPFIVWFIWEYVDWKNDIFMVTPDEIIDIDKKPFGSEERRAAQIENILNTDYKREGVIAYFFNYGTVRISVGGSQLAFEDVLDPAGVQADINRRRMTRIAKKSEDTANVERERVAAWLAAYHQNVDEFNAPMNAPEEEENRE
jgi:CRP-like cAMP-binding protein